MSGYNDKLNPDQQITAEEKIAAYLFHAYRNDDETSAEAEEGAAEAGRDLLLMILTEFRPDLISK